MAFNGSGVFQRVRNWVADAAAGIKIRADYHDSEDDNFAAGISNCIAKDGQTTVTQNIPFNGKRITNIADPVNPQDGSTKAYTDTKMPLAGGTFTGAVAVTGPSPVIVLNSTTPDGAMSIYAERAGVMRWMMRLGNGELETGSNAGSNFDLYRYDDTGTLLGQVLGFSRATGAGYISAEPTVATSIANKNYVDTRILRSGDTMAGPLVSAPSGLISAADPSPTFVVTSTNGAHAAMTFNVPGVFATNFGLAEDGNFYMGGVSHGAGTAHRFWTTRDFAEIPFAEMQAKIADLLSRVEALEAKEA